MKRLFFALWPDDATREQCVKITQSICIGDAKAVIRSNLHITLLFLGNIDSGKEAIIRQEAATIYVPKFSLKFDQLNFWQKLKVLCLTASEFNPKLITLVESLSNLAKKLEIVIDKRPFTPHITLVKKAKGIVLQKFDPIIWHSGSFCLVESCSQINGVEYRVIDQWKIS